MKIHTVAHAAGLFIAADILLVAVFCHLLPDLTRRDIFFAVTVEPSYRGSEHAHRIARRFRVEVWVASLIAAILAFAGMESGHIGLFGAGIAWQGLGIFLAFRTARKRVRPHAALAFSHAEVSFAPRPAAIHGHRLLQLGPFAILLAAALDLRENWTRIPEIFPVHWGAGGRPNGWATRSMAGVFGPLVVGFAICLGLALFSYATVHWARQLHVSGMGTANDHGSRRAQVGALLALEYFLALVFAWVALLPLRAHPREMPAGVWLIPIAALAVIIGSYAILVRSGQGGEDLDTAGLSSDILTPSGRRPGDRTPENCWICGMFYYNPADPAVLVAKRFGIGYTFNFANAKSWLLLLALIFATVAVPILIGIFSRHKP